MNRQDDLAAEGEPEKEFNPGIASRLPRKTTAGGALIRDEAGRILFLDPTYKPTLDIPGGMAEYDESPYDACCRELQEELGLELPVGDLLVVDWVPALGVWNDALAFVFDGGVLTPATIARLHIDPGEARGAEFLTLDQARPRLRPSLARRLTLALNALTAGHPLYADFGRQPAE
ncbi:ADP-ribose pyrophosphatase YjhB (NUDIX family) [Kribbella antiqua]|uniref:ADP-ribose pyrophosphatase YjhB (NUDIX family) n=1 Tax=Kribbella antiqua TaxID=2512217 RepID=A0A4V2S3M8_9ACTN|nr:NUDIX hydrolase [Kribbella antiqua]TCO45050.1 ADP-ribose pyrophosphatase YjhB (NUDIX family) [Kribbella antiqua]